VRIGRSIKKVRVIGVDPGTKSFDVCGLDDGRVGLDLSYPAETVAVRPEEIVSEIEKFRPDLVVGPSGMGIPTKRVSEMTAADRFELSIERAGDTHEIGVLAGLRKMVGMLGKSGMDVRLIPGIIHLPTVPAFRKVNKIDMGTADKMAIAALSVSVDAERENLSGYDGVNLVLIEIGFGYNASVAVKGGKIVDGIGGTNFPGPAFLNMGALDGEVAYLMGEFSKTVLFSGGVCHILSDHIIDPEEFAAALERGDETAQFAFDAYAEGILRAVAMEMLFTDTSRVYLSGRLSRIRTLHERLTRVIQEKCDVEVRSLEGFAMSAKEAAQGAAIIADGLAGGRYEKLVEHLQIRNASGSLFDQIYIPHLRSRL
jgi:predicted butyrate kinase (DUF1464 family)